MLVLVIYDDYLHLTWPWLGKWKYSYLTSQNLYFGPQVFHTYILPDYDHVTPLLKTLYWFFISFRIKSKVLVIAQPLCMIWLHTLLHLLHIPSSPPATLASLLYVYTAVTPHGLCSYCSALTYLHYWFPDFHSCVCSNVALCDRSLMTFSTL